jgi:hypothetical protein
VEGRNRGRVSVGGDEILFVPIFLFIAARAGSLHPYGRLISCREFFLICIAEAQDEGGSTKMSSSAIPRGHERRCLENHEGHKVPGQPINQSLGSAGSNWGACDLPNIT